MILYRIWNYKILIRQHYWEKAKCLFDSSHETNGKISEFPNLPSSGSGEANEAYLAMLISRAHSCFWHLWEQGLFPFSFKAVLFLRSDQIRLSLPWATHGEAGALRNVIHWSETRQRTMWPGEQYSGTFTENYLLFPGQNGETEEKAFLKLFKIR